MVRDDEKRMMMMMEQEQEEEAVPAWLSKLMGERFFGECGAHQNLRKNDKNVLCLRCCLSLCPHCLPLHPHHHPLLQVRRYVYHDVVRLGDLEKLIDCSNIQPYTINGAKVIFLNERAQSRSSCRGGTGNSCCSCDRILQDPFHFCSLSCKVDHMVYEGERLSSILHRFDESDFSFSQFEGLRVDSSSELVDEDNTQFAPNGSCSNTDATASNSVISCEANRNKNKTKTKSKSNGFFHSLGSRRKGAPHRAPFC
ncbi:hypothetical protein HN51_014217 [Arachis hypogaea]|uniref:B box-type domain-containing protein n=1 Tax=Arachis hypogaea TaxID=3818 RepID=A0A445DMF5_ARAHY|nr:uncharacterized protein LOC107634721 isoform X1 [Arachis ipaensis]XP_025640947.1 uncharacterized protein LOC112735634 [Arachis hypogaea]RYR64252.1 hypothetical protein Ahy_A03g010378 [Arachis hypogaea]